MRHIIDQLKNKVKFFFLTPAQRRHSMVGPPGLWKMKRDFQIQFLKQVGMQPQHYLLDIGCGTLRGGIPIIRHLKKGHYFGIESRREVLAIGRKELQKSNLEVKEPTLLAIHDISSVDLEVEFNIIWAFSVLIHMTDKVLNDCFGFVQKHLKKDGYCYANVNIGKQLDKKWKEFPLVYRDLEFYEKCCSEHGLRLLDIGSLRSFGHLSGDEHGDKQRMLKICKI